MGVPARQGDQADLAFIDIWYPIQVEQKEKAGRPDIDAFEAVMTREDRTKPFFVAFNRGQDALTETDAFFRKSGKVIVALTVQEILDEQIARKLAWWMHRLIPGIILMFWRRTKPTSLRAEEAVQMRHDPTDELDDALRQLLPSRQSLAVVLLDRNICPHCQRVYKRGTAAAHPCPACKHEIRTGRSYAPLTIFTLIDLIQDHYCMELSRTSAIGERVVEEKEPRHYVGIILLFCTFVECWMAQFLRSLMKSRELPEPIIDRLLSDNWTMGKRKELFEILTEKALRDAHRDLTQENKRNGGDYLDYGAVWRFVTDVFKIRNAVIHEGAIYKFSERLVNQCINNIQGVNSLFVALHNKYIAQPVDPNAA